MSTEAFRFNRRRPEVLLGTGDALPVLHGQTANICAFGASVNASAATNTAAIAEAAAYINALGGGIVFVPAGRYDIDVPSLRFLNYSNVMISGEGRYSSTLVDSQGMTTDDPLASLTGGNAFLTFVDSTACRVSHLGLSGANVWSQARLSSGLDVLTRKGIYFQSLSTGCSDCAVIDCYLENIEGEAVFADGACDNLRVNDNHFYRCQANAINWGNGDGLAAYRNRIEDNGQSSFQCGGTNWVIGHNISTMSIDPNTGLPWVTAADLVAIYNTTGALVHDNIFASYRCASTVNGITIGYNNSLDVANVTVVHNRFERIFLPTGPTNHNGVIAISSTHGAVKNVYVGDNTIINCGGSTSGGAYRTGIKVCGANAITGTIGPNVIDNGSLGTIDVGVHFDSTTTVANQLRLETQRIRPGGVQIVPVALDVASGDDARQLVGSVVWNPPSVADGAMTSTTITIGGCHVGDAGLVSFNGSGLAAGVIFHAICAVQDIMTVTLFNKSGGALDLGSGTLTVHVQKT